MRTQVPAKNASFFLCPPIRCKTFFVNHTKSVEKMFFLNDSHFIPSVRSFRNTFKLLIKKNLIQVGGLTDEQHCLHNAFKKFTLPQGSLSKLSPGLRACFSYRILYVAELLITSHSMSVRPILSQPFPLFTDSGMLKMLKKHKKSSILHTSLFLCFYGIISFF